MRVWRTQCEWSAKRDSYTVTSVEGDILSRVEKDREEITNFHWNLRNGYMHIKELFSWLIWCIPVRHFSTELEEGVFFCVKRAIVNAFPTLCLNGCKIQWKNLSNEWNSQITTQLLKQGNYFLRDKRHKKLKKRCARIAFDLRQQCTCTSALAVVVLWIALRDTKGRIWENIQSIEIKPFKSCRERHLLSKLMLGGSFCKSPFSEVMKSILSK